MPPAEQTHNVSFLTDVEGNWEFLERFINLSDALQLEAPPDESGAAQITLNDGWQLVVGGDLCDKGAFVGGTVRVVRSIVALKKKYPDRVTIILGNRDINKMRFTSELSLEQLDDSRLERVPGPYWVPESKRVSPLMFLRGLSVEKFGTSVTDSMTNQQIAASFNTIINRLRWMLKETMGADGELERRRAELALLRGERRISSIEKEASVRNVERSASGSGDGDFGIADVELVASFTDCVREGGFMRELFELGQLAVITGSTLFVHGGVVSPGGVALGKVPDVERDIEDVHEWVNELNRWYHSQLEDWIKRPHWEDDEKIDLFGSRGGHQLMDYVVPSPRPTVVLAKHLTPSGMPQPLDDDLTRRLNASGIYRICVGHTPHGSCPTVIKCPGVPIKQSSIDDDSASSPELSATTPKNTANGSFARRPTVENSVPALEIIMADTSYSDMKAKDNRGESVSEVQILPDGCARIHGRIDGKRVIDYKLGPVRAHIRAGAPLPPLEEGMDLIGLQAPVEKREPATLESVKDDEASLLSRFVKAWLPDKQAYLLCFVDGFKHSLNEVPREVAHVLFGETKGGLPADDAERQLAMQRYSDGLASESSSAMVSYHSVGDEGCSHLEEEDASHFTNSLLQLLFSTMDANNNGVISRTELSRALKEFPEILKLLAGTGQEPPEPSKLMREIDTGGNGDISREELREYLFNIKKFDRKRTVLHRMEEQADPKMMHKGVLGLAGRSHTAGPRVIGDHNLRGGTGNTFRAGSVPLNLSDDYKVTEKEESRKVNDECSCCVWFVGWCTRPGAKAKLRNVEEEASPIAAPSIASQERV